MSSITDEMDELMTLGKAAFITGQHRSTLWAACKAGKLDHEIVQGRGAMTSRRALNIYQQGQATTLIAIAKERLKSRLSSKKKRQPTAKAG